MNGGSRIIDIRPGVTDPVPPEDLLLTDVAPEPVETLLADEADMPAPAARSGIIGPALAMLAVAAWIGGMLWLTSPTLAAGIAPLDLVELIAALCVPPALIGILWLLAMRSSTAEAARFGGVVRQLRSEAASLERTIAIVARQVDGNRRALAKQTDALMRMGDGASERLVAISNGMATQIATADEQARRLAEAITAAQEHLSQLLAALPKAHSDTIGVTTALNSAGLAAGEHARALDAQLAALAERGREADAIADGAARKLADHVATMEATSDTAGARLEAVTAAMSGEVDSLLDRTASAVDEARKGIAAQGDAMRAMLEANQAALSRVSEESVTALAERISGIEGVIDRIAARIADQRGASAAMVNDADSGFTAIEARIAAFHQAGIDRTQTLAASISALGGSADAMTEALKAGDDMAHRVIATSENLLVSLDAAAREIDETLPDALARLDERINQSRAVVTKAKPEMLSLVTAAESTHDAIEAIAQVIQGQRVTLDQLSALLLDTLTSGREKADAIGASMDDTIARAHDFAEQAAPRLIEALMRVRDTASTAAERARETLSSVIPDATRALELASGKAIQRALGNSVTEQVDALVAAADAAVEAAGRASDRLTQQMLNIAETTALVEERIADARAEREQADTDSFARRASLLIETLNSAAIDISKSVSGEVSDSAWAAYLKGDRGVFTRRAVRLLDTGDARNIARLYDDDRSFREQVNRYIHDFEAMLRAILAQRDGSPLGVTLLSSDMGKLYVALAQAIERLRS